MGLRQWLSLAVQALLVVVVLSLILGAVLGQPILFSYVETGSMAPTLQPGDGFVAIPTAIAGPITQDDVVVFQAEEIEGGGLTTHRIVDETDRGFVTKGDANPFTDQDSGEPPVQGAEIVAVAWQPGGAVLSIPALGTLVSTVQSVLDATQRQLAALFGTRAFLGTQGLAYLLLAVSILLYGIDVWFEDGTDRERSRERETGRSARLVVAIFAGAIVLAATAAMVVPAGTQEIGVVSAEFQSSQATVIEQGTSGSMQQVLGNGGIVPVVAFFESETEGIEIQPRRVELAGQSRANATVTITAPPDTGYYQYYFTEHRYLRILPLRMIETLYGVHPWLPIVAIDALLGIPFYLVAVRLLGTGRLRSRKREGPSTTRRLIDRYL